MSFCVYFTAILKMLIYIIFKSMYENFSLVLLKSSTINLNHNHPASWFDPTDGQLTRSHWIFFTNVTQSSICASISTPLCPGVVWSHREMSDEIRRRQFAVEPLWLMCCLVLRCKRHLNSHWFGWKHIWTRAHQSKGTHPEAVKITGCTLCLCTKKNVSFLL